MGLAFNALRAGYERHAAVATFVLVAGGIGVWVVRTDPGTLRNQLSQSQFWTLEAQALLVATLSIYQWPHAIRMTRASSRHYTAVAAASVLAFSLSSALAPRTSRIYYDEQIYQSVGRNLRDLKLAQMCNEGTLEAGRLRCWRGEYNKQPYGYPYVLSLAYRLVGVREWIPFGLNNLTAALTVWVLFFATVWWFEDPRAGVFAALIAALIPIQLLWCNTAAAEPTASLTSAAAVMGCISFLRTRTTLSLWWTVALSVFAAQFRPESLLILPFVALLISIHAGRELSRPRVWWAAAAGLALCAVLAGHLVAVRGERWGTSSDRLSLAYVVSNLSSNGWFYLRDARFPFAYTVLAAAGALSVPRRALMPLAYFAMYWAVFLPFYAGSYNYGADVRYSLMTYPPLAMLAGVGAAAVLAALARVLRSGAVATAIVVGCLVGQFTWYVPLVATVGEEAWGARADVAFAREVARTLPPNAIVLTHNPSMFQLWGVSAAQASLVATEPEYVRTALFPRHAGAVYFHWNFWCNVIDPVPQALCRDVLERFPHELVQEYRERDFRYAFYRLAPPSPPP